MGLTATGRDTPAHAGVAGAGADDGPAAVVWHDLECGGYDADLALWHALAAEHAAGGAPVLEIGAGTGRVALDLLARGHEVTAVELDGRLLAALGDRSAALGTPAGALRCVHGDARELELERRDFALCIVAMQTLQLFAGSARRGAFLRRAREHLRPGGVLACAIVAELEPFDCDAGEPGPEAERVRCGDREYLSRAVRVRASEGAIAIERLREVRAVGGTRALARERSVVELDRVSAAGLAAEARAVGLRELGVRSVPATTDHVGSTVVMFGA